MIPWHNNGTTKHNKAQGTTRYNKAQQGTRQAQQGTNNYWRNTRDIFLARLPQCPHPPVSAKIRSYIVCTEIIASFSACGIEINVVMRCSPSLASPFGCYVETLIAFALIHQNDGSSDGSPPTGDEQQPSASYLRQRFLQSNNNISVMSPSPLFGLLTDLNTLTPESSLTCIDTPNWKDLYGNGCDW